MYLFVAIKKNREFIRAYKRGKSAVTPCLAMYYYPNKQDLTRMGITASKKIGGAVERNRAKRVIRAAFASLCPEIKAGYDFIIVARGKTPHVKSTQIYDELFRVLSEQSLLVKSEN